MLLLVFWVLDYFRQTPLVLSSTKLRSVADPPVDIQRDRG